MNADIDGAVVRWDLENQSIPKNARCSRCGTRFATRSAARVARGYGVKVYTTPDTPKDLLVQFTNCGFDVALRALVDG